jgi:RNA polymerase sigma factor for flagellar operon FliA
MTREGTPDDANELLSQCLPVVRRIVAFVCRRRHLTAADGDDFSSYVTVKLLEDDAAILRKFAGRSSLQTFLSVVIQRLFLDYRRAAWGKWRPSAQAKRLGALAILIEQLIARDGHNADETYEIVATNHGQSLSRAEFDRIVAGLPQRQVRKFEDDVVLAGLPSGSPLPDEDLAAEETSRQGRRVDEALRHVMASLPAEDRLLLTLQFYDGRTVAEISSMLGLEQKALYRRFDRLLRDLRRQLEAAGLEAAVFEVLGVGRSALEQERSDARPSSRKGGRPWP